MSVAQTPNYISTLGSVIESKEPDRINITTLTEQFLNQGGKIQRLNSTTAKSVTHNRLSTEHNKKTADINKKRRDKYRDDVKKLLTEGLPVMKIIKEIGITHHVFSKIVEEDNLEHLLNQGE